MKEMLIVQKLNDYLSKHTDKERAKKEKQYLYSNLKHYGVSIWELREFVKHHKKELTSLSKSNTLELVKQLWSKGSHEERTVALFILDIHKQTLTIQDMPLIETLMRESKGWALLDNLIIPFMPHIIKKDSEAYTYLKKWIKDNDFWVRRSALLSQLLFFRKGENGNRKLFFDMAVSQFDESWIEKQYQDTESKKRARFFIRKAIGWSLREMARKNPEIVVDFLHKHKSKMSGLTYRDASRKLPQGMKDKLKTIQQ